MTKKISLTTPLKVELTDFDIDVITKLAHSQGITATSAVCKAISDEFYVLEKQKAGTQFFAIDPDGSQYEVSF